MDKYKFKNTTLELETLSYLSSKTGLKLSQRDIAKDLQVSPTAIGNALKKLSQQNLINVEKNKTINFVSFNRDNKEAIYFKITDNLSKIFKSKIIEELNEKLAGATVILFGSYSKGEDMIKSDIDLAIIGRKEKNLDLKLFEEFLERKININFYESWDKIHLNLKNNILNGIVLSGGIELD